MTQPLKRKEDAARLHPRRASLVIIPIALLAALWSTMAGADSLPPQINMYMNTEEREPGVIKTTVMDDTKVSKVTLYYRTPGEIRYNSIDMKHRDDLYYRELKREFGVSGTVEYYILAQDASGNQTSQPPVNPEERPMRTALDANVNQSAEEVVLSSPEPGTMVLSGDQLVIVTFYKTDREVDMATVRFRLDDRDRTRDAQIQDNMIIWQPRYPLVDGTHMIEVIARDTSGNAVGPNVWTFQVKSKIQLPLGAKGNFFMGLQRDDRSNKSSGIVPLYNNRIDLGLEGEKSWLSWNAGVMLSSEDMSFLTSEKLAPTQPVSRFYFDARSRNLRVHFGDDNPNFSDLSLNGILVRGLSASYKSNYLNVDLVRGYNQRNIGDEVEVVQGVSNVNAASYVDQSGQAVDISSMPFQRIIQDSNGVFHVYEFSQGSLKRNITALKLDISPVRNRYATWNFGINLFTAEDDSTSLKYAYNDSLKTRYAYYNFANSQPDSFVTEYNPKKNWVGTVQTSLRFNNNRSVVTAEFGGTLVTDNMFGVVSEDIKSELPTQISDKLFRFNGSTQTSFDKMKLKDNVGKGVLDALTSVYSLKLMTPLPIPKLSSRFRGEVYRIPTHYVSLGNPNQKTDIGGYKLDLRSQALKDQVSLDLGYEVYSDNLDSERQQFGAPDNTGNPTQKDLTKDTKTANVTVSYRPQILPDYAPNMSIGYRTYTAVNNLDLVNNTVVNPGDKSKIPDWSKKLDMFTNTLMLTLGGIVPVGEQRHAATVSISTMAIGDNRDVASYVKNESDNTTVMLNVNSAINPLPLSLNITLGQTGNKAYYQITPTDGSSPSRKSLTTDITMVNLTATYKWFRDRRMSTLAGFGFIGSSNGDTGTHRIDNTKTTVRFEAEYKVNQMTAAGASLRFLNFTDTVNKVNNFTEPILGFTLRSNF
ncbi:MAG: hypothetical protein Q8O92_15080 [Candidatus Latescibacter sp.]|nr:hypothetical protein [Candidatus Latescibacter sp.]